MASIPTLAAAAATTEATEVCTCSDEPPAGFTVRRLVEAADNSLDVKSGTEMTGA